MAEFMEHGADVVEADQRGLAGRRLGEVRDIVDHGLGAQQFRLADEIAHPGAAGFVVALEIVEIHQAQRLAVLVEDLEHHHIGLIDRNVVALLEGDAIKLIGGIENAILQHLVEFEIGLERRLIQVIARLAHFLGIALPVPRLQVEMRTVLVDRLLDQFGFLGRLGAGGRHKLADEFFHRVRRLRHLVVEHIGGIVGIAQKLGLVGPQHRQARDDCAGIVAIAFFGARPALVEQLFAHAAVFQRGEQRLLRRVLQRNDVFARQLARLGRFHRRRHFAVGQARKIGLVAQHQAARLGGRHQLLLELRFQAGVFLVDLFEMRLVLVRQQRAGMDKLAVVKRQDLQRLRVQLQAGALVVQRLDPREEFGVEENRVIVRRQLRRLQRLHLVQRGIGVGLHHREEGVVDPLEHAPRTLQTRRWCFRNSARPDWRRWRQSPPSAVSCRYQRPADSRRP